MKRHIGRKGVSENGEPVSTWNCGNCGQTNDNSRTYQIDEEISNVQC